MSKNISKSPSAAVVCPEDVKRRPFYTVPQGRLQRGFLKVRSESPAESGVEWGKINGAAWPARHAARETKARSPFLQLRRVPEAEAKRIAGDRSARKAAVAAKARRDAS
jgi:hypothetical protein